MSSFMAPIRGVSFSSNNSTPQGNSSSISMSSEVHRQQSTPSIKRMDTVSTTNSNLTCDDSLYYISLRLMNSLAKVPGMLPYIELAYNEADTASEKQAMAISSSITSSSSNTPISDSSNSSDMLLNNGSSLSISNRSSTTTNSNPSSGSLHTYLLKWNESMYTFATGLLPAQISYDPVTPLSKLLKQGAPLCLLFNALKPENAIEVVSSDNLKICKTSVYNFVTACQLHLNTKNDELFTISQVFSDSTTNLLDVIHSVNFILSLEPSFISDPIPDQIIITDSRSKIVKELIQTERKFVQDLETLVNYRDDLIKANCILNEDINMLFPSLNEIIDFQRKFLIGLECNAIVPHKYQRIGSAFIHAGVESFKIYENWSLFQSFANDLIQREANKLRNVSNIIKDPYELQNFYLIKPIQRLLKYPLLLSQLLKETDQSWPNYNELHQAYLISKEVAFTINESKRRSENLVHLNQLNERVSDWKGYNTKNVGDLLHLNVVTVKDLLTDGHSNEKEVHCYLFEKVIYFFKESSSTKNKLLGSKKNPSIFQNSSHNNSSNNSFMSSNSDFNNNNNNNNQSNLTLNGIVYISRICKITASDNSQYFPGTPGHYLTLRWKGNKDTGGCIMKFKSEESLKQWHKTIKQLSIDLSNAYEDTMLSNHHISKSISSLSSSTSLLTSSDNRSSSTTTSTNNRNSDKLRTSSDSSTFMRKLRSTSSSSFTNLSNVNYPPLPTEKTLRSLSISSVNNSFINPKIHKKSPSNSSSSILNDDLKSNFSNLTLKQTSPVISHENSTMIKLIFNENQSSINLSVNSDISYETLVSLLIDKMNINMNSDQKYTFENITIKFKDEDGDYIRFRGEDDWIIAKEMLEEMESDYQILELCVSMV